MHVAFTLLLAASIAGCREDGPREGDPPEEDPPEGGTLEVDLDQDGHGADEDCDDRDPLIWPGAPDTVGDGVDQSCDGVDGVDADRDGHASDQGGGDDCDDLDPARHPGATDAWYDGVDQDCDGACDGDQDGDGSVVEGWTVTDGGPCDADPGAGRASAPIDCDDTDPLAEALLVSTSPSAGSGDARPWRPIRATLYELDASGVLALTDSAGTPVPGASTWTGSTLVFTPDQALDPLSSYTAELSWGCGTERWSFTTDDGTGQDFLHRWTTGPPDLLSVDPVNPVATLYRLGLAETGTGAVGWYGEDCAGPLATGSCHPMGQTAWRLESVRPDVGAVVPGATTLFDASSDGSITYYAEARDGDELATCWAWGHDPGYFSQCEAL